MEEVLRRIRGIKISNQMKRFIISHTISILWVIISIALSITWINELSNIVTMIPAVVIIMGIAYIPAYVNSFLIASLLTNKDKLEINKDIIFPNITILIACYNEEGNIKRTLKHIFHQKYSGDINVIVIDNNSTDRTTREAIEAGNKFNLNLTVLKEDNVGKNFALNYGLSMVKTELMITLDADTLLHSLAIKNIVSKYINSPSDTCAVAGSIIARNGKKTLMSKIQDFDYFIAIASIKRLQGSFSSTLVAQGAFSLFKTQAVRDIGGWEDKIGEDIVLTWSLLKNNHKVLFEPTAIAFTDVPETLSHFIKQRSRWARGMIEAIKIVKPWNQPSVYTKYLTGMNLTMPFVDSIYVFVWMPSLILAFFGYYWVVGFITLFVLPLAIIQNIILYSYQKKVFKKLRLRVKRNVFGLILYILVYQMIMSPISVYGCCQELFNLKKVWK